jgi:hypothetical protein
MKAKPKKHSSGIRTWKLENKFKRVMLGLEP